MRCRLILIAIGLLLSGCSMGTFRYGEKKAKPAGTHSPTRASAAMVVPAEDGTVTRLVINGEVIEAEKLVAPLRDELREVSQRLTTEEYAYACQEKLIRAIGDRLSETLLYQEASNRMGKQDNQAIDAAVDSELRARITREYDGVQRRYENALRAEGRSVEEAREQLRREFVVLRYMELTLKPKVAEPTREELFRLFEENRQRWAKPARREMSLITVNAADMPPGDPGSAEVDRRAAARRWIEQAEAELKQGAAFAEVARKYGHGALAETGGSWGAVTIDGVQDRYRPAVEALYRLDEGQVSAIIEGPESFYLVRCDEVSEGFDPKFEDIQVQLKAEHFRRAYLTLANDHIAELRAKARIEPANIDLFLLGAMKLLPQKG
jgi:parvulin-like peptidyl-prolyl isomerase